ncbi:hypothetical protein [Alkaliphilus sp. B6464]|uniref:hypothetical protein n=1 Tax=Alkaliphilus sp. B6464 TaxID=2731219 RepID=UPI001BA725DE|nr:hypothetical protein [Alkaliphilus sp. B6464]QUH21444.1 hypothetical protein HYG84_17180 [Alkaliphilus sp. B6464]
MIRGKKGEYIWEKQDQDLMLKLIEENASMTKLEIEFKCSHPIILKELKRMGFEGLRDARRVLKG